MKTVAELFRHARAMTGWNPQECARHAGHENVDRGANRLLAIERGQTPFPEERVWGPFADALDIDRGHIREALAAEQAQLRSIRFEGLPCDPDDMEKHVFFFHGKESGPYGRKYRALSERLSVDAPDFQNTDIEERLRKAEFLTRHMTDIVVIGSSYGGLLAALLYSLHPERFKGYLLLAPALHLKESERIERVSTNAVVIHGREDEVVPFDTVKAFCRKFSLNLVTVDDTHRLHNSLDVIKDHAEQVLTNTDT